MKRLLLLLSFAVPVAAQPVDTTLFRVGFEAVAPLDTRLFGQFLERPSWGGETGPEGAWVEAEGGLMPEAVEAIESMNIPVIRWPGGTDIDYMDWTEMIDNAPGRAEPGRPVSIGHTGAEITNDFGMDEGLTFIEGLGAETILVLNLGDAIFGARSIEDAAMHAAGLVAYANAPVGATLPEGMPDWPAIRAQNGRAEPWDVRYIQIGNETWGFRDEDGRIMYPYTGSVDADDKALYYDALEAFLDAIEAVDPDAEIIADGATRGLVQGYRARFGDRLDYLTFHLYHPWAMSTVTRDGESLDARAFALDPDNRDDIWRAWVAPRHVAADGTGMLSEFSIDHIRAAGYPAVVTEWNWNGRWDIGDSGGAYDSFGARAMGGFSYLHEFMRRSEDIPIATQSMLLGEWWGIAGVRYYSNIGLVLRRPSAIGMAFYTRHHGDRRVALEHDGLTTYDQPYSMGYINAQDGVAYLDPIATRTDDTLYVHVLNRRYEDADSSLVRIDLSAYPELGAAATHHTMHILTGSGQGGGSNPLEAAWVTSQAVPVVDSALEVAIAPHSMTVVAVPLQAGGSTSTTAPPSGFAVGPPSPNPARGSVSLAVTLAEPAAVGAVVYDALGRVVLEVPERPLASGTQAFAFSTEALPSGTYVVRLTARGAETSQSARLVTVVR